MGPIVGRGVVEFTIGGMEDILIVGADDVLCVGVALVRNFGVAMVTALELFIVPCDFIWGGLCLGEALG